MQPQQARHPSHLRPGVYSWLLCAGALAAALLWLIIGAPLVDFNPIQHFLSPVSPLAFLITAVLVALPLLIGVALMLHVGRLLLVRSQAVEQIATLGKIPSLELAAWALWVGIMLIAFYLLFCLEALFNLSPSVTLVIGIWVIFLCMTIAPLLTVKYMHRLCQP